MISRREKKTAQVKEEDRLRTHDMVADDADQVSSLLIRSRGHFVRWRDRFHVRC